MVEAGGVSARDQHQSRERVSCAVHTELIGQGMATKETTKTKTISGPVTGDFITQPNELATAGEPYFNVRDLQKCIGCGPAT